MSQILKLRDGSSVYVTDQQAENLFTALNENPNVRILKILTGSGYHYVNPFSIVSMTPAMGEGYRSNEQIEQEQQRFLNSPKAKALNGGSDVSGLIA